MVIALLRKVIPAPVLSLYHFLLAMLGAFLFGFPGKHLTVIAITGTKGKSSVSEMMAAILEEAGYKTALANTIRFSIAGESRPNRFKMTTPGRFFLQQFLRRAVDAGCTHAVIELTSEGARQYRHLFLSLNALIVTNLAKEHIESHGSFEKYADAKLSIAQALATSSKKHRAIIVPARMPYVEKFLTLGVPIDYSFALEDAQPYALGEQSISFTFKGVLITAPLTGTFNIENALATLTLAEHLGISTTISARALAHLPQIKGRVEPIECGQDFSVIVDYAHTPESLQALYDAFPNRRKICVLGNTGGGRDAWKRAEMGAIADSACAEVILTDEDPYDENPVAIVNSMAQGMKRKPTIVMDRRSAMYTAFKQAARGDVVLITGKGTDPYIMGPQGTKTEWSDAKVAREELQKFLTST